MTSKRSIRRFVALACAVAMVVPAAALVRLVPTAAADDQIPMQFMGFIHLSDLTSSSGAHPDPSSGAVHIVGVDDGLGAVVLRYTGFQDYGIYTLDPQKLTQTAFIPTQLQVADPYVDTLDPTTHRVYIGGQTRVGSNTECFSVPLLCEQGPAAQAPQIETVDLAAGKSLGTYTLPAAADGMDIASLTATTTPSGRHVLLALLFENRAGAAQDSQTYVAHRLALMAFDADKLGTTNADPFLWTDDLSASCAGLMSFTKGAREFLGVDPAGHFAYFGCRGLILDGEAYANAAGAVAVDFTAPDGATADLPASASSFTTSLYPYGSNSQISNTDGNSALGVLLVHVLLGQHDKLYVFDANHRDWVGSAPYVAKDSAIGAAVNQSTGVAYIYAPSTDLISLSLTDIPVQGPTYLSMGDLEPSGGSTPIVDPATNLVWLPVSQGQYFEHQDGTQYPADDVIAVYRDPRPAPDPPVQNNPDDQTHDIPLTSDTPVTYGSFASAYGAKAILVGGVRAINGGNSLQPANASDSACFVANFPLTVSGSGQQLPCQGLVPSTTDADRTITLGDVSDNEMSNSAADGNAATLAIDSSSAADEKSLSHYNPADDMWNRFVQPATQQEAPQAPAGTPQPPDTSQYYAPAACEDFGSGTDAKTGPGSTATCDYGSQQANAAAASDLLAGPNGATAEKDPSTQASPLQIGYAGAATSVVHTSDNQAVTQAKAVARGISLAIPGGPSLTIGDVTTTAMSVAAGRPGTANSSFQRSVHNVVIRDPAGKVVYSCGFAGADDTQCDPRQMTDAMSQFSPSPIVFRMPTPDPGSRATPGGAEAEVIKSQWDYWNDYFTNADTSNEIPGLQIIYIGDQTQPSRLVLSLAGVHIESHDAIGLPPPPPPQLADPTLKLSLTDGSTPPVPLAGGEFALVADDGTTAATCSTAADGIGSCSFPDVKPGSYSIKETKAPPGYAAAPDYKISLDPGQDYTATFVNLLAIGSVHVSLTSAVDKKPLPGAVFAMYAGTSTLGTPVSTCTTDKDGTCGFTKVPLASYTMHQQVAPKGFVLSKDVPFDLTDPGQDATLTFVDGTPAVTAVQGKFIPGKPAVAPHTEVVGGGGGMSIPAVPASYSPGDMPPVVSSAPAAQAPVVAGLPQRLLNLPAQLARLLTQSPQQAVLLLFMWLVFGLPVYLWARRRQLVSATEGT